MPSDCKIIFNCYVKPSFLNGVSVWFNYCSEKAISGVNVVLAKFLKLYLSVPVHTNNAIVYHVTESIPFHQDWENDYIRENMRVEQKMM